MPVLDAYTSVKSHLYVRLQIDEYRTTAGGSYSAQVLRFSDDNTNLTINGELYTPLGEFLSITSSTSELRPTGSSVNIVISGIPTNNIAEILHSKIKGSPVEIYRGYFDVGTGSIIGSVQGRFLGSVNNLSLEEEFDVVSRTASNIIQLECSSNVEILSNKFAGRKTNPTSMKKFYSTDTSFDRIPNLADTTFNFGAPQ